jgi:geranylgeranyl diphosphate synthase type II
MDIKQYLQEKKKIIDIALESYFLKFSIHEDQKEVPPSLLKAIHHSLFSGGKRIRPILCISAYEAVGGRGEKIIPFACAIEMIHTYSLIHDDLPAIDNDDYRRGVPTCHKVFGEALSILAGDGLLTEAFKLMSIPPNDGNEALILELIHEIANASGISGMVGGQVVDIESEGKEVSPLILNYIHTHKTGALIRTSIRVGAKLGGADQETLNAFTHYGEKVGLAFQIIDDILNVEGNFSQLGKSVGTDIVKKKVTFPGLFGLEESKKKAKELIELAIHCLSSFGPEVDPLREIAWFMISREY